MSHVNSRAGTVEKQALRVLGKDLSVELILSKRSPHKEGTAIAQAQQQRKQTDERLTVRNKGKEDTEQ
jgi:hypothetical protein